MFKLTPLHISQQSGVRFFLILNSIMYSNRLRVYLIQKPFDVQTKLLQQQNNVHGNLKNGQ